MSILEKTGTYDFQTGLRLIGEATAMGYLNVK